jgi:hypothetical protein
VTPPGSCARWTHGAKQVRCVNRTRPSHTEPDVPVPSGTPWKRRPPPARAGQESPHRLLRYATPRRLARDGPRKVAQRVERGCRPQPGGAEAQSSRCSSIDISFSPSPVCYDARRRSSYRFPPSVSSRGTSWPAWCRRSSPGYCPGYSPDIDCPAEESYLVLLFIPSRPLSVTMADFFWHLRPPPINRRSLRA